MASAIKPTLEYWFVFQNDHLLFIQNEEEQKLVQSALIRCYSLGQFQEKNIYCAEIRHDFIFTNAMQLLPMRQALESLSPEWYGLAVKAYSIIRWDQNHRYCGRCGSQTIKLEDRFERVCTDCSLTFYPRISPCVIVLIQKEDKILLARGHHFKPGVYGLIAGFVESGETLEEAIQREVKEEVGIEIKNLTYFGSQAWPFPDSLMVSFIAEYACGELTINPTEIETANWYDYDNLPGLPSTRISIARKLIDYFVELKKANYASRRV